ncbi:MAG TPA: methyltransferase domain-containing protein [Gaiellaceae bacterium]
MHRLRPGDRRGRGAAVDDPKEIVRAGYDAIADRFAAWQSEISDETRLRNLADLLALLPERPDVLELGVGAGVESSRILAERGRLTGIDLSGEQLRRARTRLPDARLVHGDFTAVALPPASFDAVVSFYVLNNLPQDELGPLLRRIVGWLRPGGWFLASFPSTENPGWRGEWLGTEMYFAGSEPETNRRLTEQAGLEVVRDELEVMVEPEGEVRWQWLLAQRPGR